MTLADVIPRLRGVKPEGDGYKALCPCHHDTNPSLSLRELPDGTLLAHCLAGCEQSRVWRTLLELAGHSRPSRGNSRPASRTSRAENRPESPSTRLQGCTLPQLAEAKMLNPELLREWRTEDGQYRGRSAVKIPHYAENGELLSVQWRVALEGDRFRREGRNALYGLWKVPTYALDKQLWVCEGCSDC